MRYREKRLAIDNKVISSLWKEQELTTETRCPECGNLLKDNDKSEDGCSECHAKE